MNTPFAEPGSAPGVPCSVDFYDPALFALDGRIGRVRYFAYCCAMSCLCLLAAGVIVLACAGVAMMLLLGLLYLMTVGASLILFVRRLHDLDRSGWMSLLLLIPLVNVALDMFARAEGDGDVARHADAEHVLGVVGDAGRVAVAPDRVDLFIGTPKT